MNIHDNTVHMLMEQAQVFASRWAIAGSRFDSGDGLETAETEKQVLRRMIENALAAAPTPPVQQDDDALEVLREIITAWGMAPGLRKITRVSRLLDDARAFIAKRGEK